jgi:hypothetical protein
MWENIGIVLFELNSNAKAYLWALILGLIHKFTVVATSI